MSLPLQFDSKNALHVVKVAGYTCASGAIVLLVNLLPFIHTENAALLLLESIFVNNIAVALEQWLGAQAAKEQNQIVPPAPPVV